VPKTFRPPETGGAIKAAVTGLDQPCDWRLTVGVVERNGPGEIAVGAHFEHCPVGAAGIGAPGEGRPI